MELLTSCIWFLLSSWKQSLDFGERKKKITQILPPTTQLSFNTAWSVFSAGFHCKTKMADDDHAIYQLRWTYMYVLRTGMVYREVFINNQPWILCTFTFDTIKFNWSNFPINYILKCNTRNVQLIHTESLSISLRLTFHFSRIPSDFKVRWLCWRHYC
jgi:hypothetical protein